MESGGGGEGGEDTSSGAAVLPDDVWLEVFGFLHPHQLATGLMLACRRFAALARTPAVWRRYHRTHLGGPLQLVVPPASSSFWRDMDDSDDDDSIADYADADDGEEGRQAREDPVAQFLSTRPVFSVDGWRQAMQWKLAKVTQQTGHEARLVWAARLGCHKLVERILNDAVSMPVPTRLPDDEESEEARVLRMLCRALCAACWANSLPSAKVLLMAGAAPVQTGYLGVKREALVEAVEHGNVELMELLIAHGALSEEWNYVSLLPGNPILAACRSGNVEAVRCLLRHGVMCVASQNEMIVDWGPRISLTDVSSLSMAARGGHINVVSLLIDHIGDRLSIGEKQSALGIAVAAGNNDMIKHLLSYGFGGNSDMLIMYLTSPAFQVDVFELLLQGISEEEMRKQSVSWHIFASVHIRKPHGRQVCELAKSRGANINVTCPDTPNLTPLGLAVVIGDVDMAANLLACGADPCVPISGESSLLDLALKSSESMAELFAKLNNT